MNRPYTANYAIGFMFVTGIILFFQGMCGIAYPDIFDYFDVPENVIYLMAVLSIVMFVLSGMLFLGIPIAHKIALVVLVLDIGVTLADLDPESIGFLDFVLIILSISSIVLLLAKPNLEFYSGFDMRMRLED
ncbi:MAG: hypothetical protein IKR87_00995 [Candidatus Methanomethylophilaceae archaeon]|nr:hypothetical protein [Candidatus Methanomethylophilaceae archaeon]MBR4181034.1 hypothetical protein [Candidatus Methanomethylophilaceae archaeon]MBR4216294.1 hypothetical protein [Candidatus Methanomethylophilaceae archaeon]